MISEAQIFDDACFWMILSNKNWKKRISFAG